VKPKLPRGSDSSRDAPGETGAGEPPQDRWIEWGAFATAIVLVIVVTVANLVSRETSPRGAASTSLSAERGIACAQLEKAYERRAVKDEVGFVAALRTANQDARRALQESHVVFGEPERIAIELYLSLSNGGVKTPAAKIDRLMTAARDSCVGLGRWPA
jgi:hypothetical protein